MRLDHLLSKEHLAGQQQLPGPEPCQDEIACSCPSGWRVAWVVLEGGTLTSSAGSRSRAPGTAAPLWGGVERSSWVRVVVGALLGPEGTGDR